MKMNSEARRIGVAGLLLGMALALAGCPVTNIVTFPDQALEDAIRTKLDVGWAFVTEADMATLRTLDLSGLGIQNLQGLEYCTSLTWLDLSSTTDQANAVTDLSPLSGLVNLTWLNLDTNEVSNIHPIEGLVNLGYLNLENNDISDIDPLAGLFYLTNLLLSGNDIWDLSALVANAENGGISYGTIITVSETNLVDEDGNMWPDIADQVDRLVTHGVTVVLTSTVGGK